MKKNTVLIAGSEVTKDALLEQLKEYLGEDTPIAGYASDDGLKHLEDADLYIISSEIVYDELLDANYSFDGKNIIIGKRTVRYDYLDQIVAIPSKTKVLFVNDMKETTEEGIETIVELGLNHIDYTPYYPGVKLKEEISITITPGELESVPKEVKVIINIGTRIFDFLTLAKILNAYGVLNDKGEDFSKKYLQEIIKISHRLSSSRNEIVNLNEGLENVIDGLEEGLMAYNKAGVITVCNEHLKRMLKLRGNIIGTKLSKVILNKLLLGYLQNHNQLETMIMTLEGEEILISKVKVRSKETTVISFKASNPRVFTTGFRRSEVINKGYIAKYTHNDIVGKSDVITEAKNIAKKLAETEMTILIEGESGTGKEMFASAIHNWSYRKNGPFLAVNFSALPDDLIESELFGYEEGAFTGATKGGKPGLFEQADDGTIFLDEIGDISLKVQSRLLRVLEEKEVMRIGGNKIRPINVRIIAATNKNLMKLVSKRQFREDLYFRLKMGYVHLPPLRERRDDIGLIINHLLQTSSIEEVEINREVYNELLKHDWVGNVRELKNTITYMLAMKNENILTLEDLPQKHFFQETKLNDNNENNMSEVPYIDKFDLFILESISNNIGIGRKALAEMSGEKELGMTENQVRTKLDKLERKELIIKKKGRHGTSLTRKGESLL